MLFKQRVLDRIARGEVTVAFRWWRRPTVRRGGRLRTPVGELAIDRVEAIAPADIADMSARAAGFTDRAAALAELSEGSGQLYRIAFRLVRDDPRTGLADDDDLDANAIDRIRAELRDLDRQGHGPAWTDTLLRLVSARPGVAASRLTDIVKIDKLVVKRRMRRLKELGLTQSLTVGYRLSPRGQRFLRGLTAPEKLGGSIEATATSIAIRNAEAADVDILANIWLEGWSDAHGDLLPAELTRFQTLDGFRSRLLAGLDKTSIAVLDGRPVGFAMVEGDELDQLYVARTARGAGAAIRLLSEAVDRIRRAGHRRAWLACAIGNHRAARFYEGGLDLGRRRDDPAENLRWRDAAQRLALRNRGLAPCPIRSHPTASGRASGRNSRRRPQPNRRCRAAPCDTPPG
jgi:GNAT superfamily N-acetyltransferase